MAKLLVVEGSNIVRSVFKSLLEDNGEFEFDLVATYVEAKTLLTQTRYDYAVVERRLSDAKDGEIIPLLNKHNVTPLVFTKEIDEAFFEVFDGSQIVDYVIKQKYNNVSNVIDKLSKLKANRDISVLIVNNSRVYTNYLKQNLNLHSFNVISAASNEEAIQKIGLHPEIKILIVDENRPDVDALELVRDVRLEKSSADLKILALVHEPNLFSTGTLLSNGVDDYIVKEFSRSEFYVRIYQNLK